MTPAELEAGAIAAIAKVDAGVARRVLHNTNPLRSRNEMDETKPTCTGCEVQYEDGTFQHSEINFESDSEIEVTWSCRNCGHLNRALFTFDRLV